MFAAEAFSDVLVVDGCALLMMLHEFMPALPKNIRIYKCFLLPSATHPFCLGSFLMPFLQPPPLPLPYKIYANIVMIIGAYFGHVCDTFRISVSIGEGGTHHFLSIMKDLDIPTYIPPPTFSKRWFDK